MHGHLGATVFLKRVIYSIFYTVFFSVESGKQDLQEFVECREEYVVIITWIINQEKRLLELRDDQSGDDEALRKRRILIEVGLQDWIRGLPTRHKVCVLLNKLLQFSTNSTITLMRLLPSCLLECLPCPRLETNPYPPEYLRDAQEVRGWIHVSHMHWFRWWTKATCVNEVKNNQYISMCGNQKLVRINSLVRQRVVIFLFVNHYVVEDYFILLLNYTRKEKVGKLVLNWAQNHRDLHKVVINICRLIQFNFLSPTSRWTWIFTLRHKFHTSIFHFWFIFDFWFTGWFFLFYCNFDIGNHRGDYYLSQ